MKKHLGKIFLLLGCLGIVFAIAGIFLFTGLSVVRDVTEKELSPLNAVPEDGEKNLDVGSENRANQLIEDLAYIKVFSVGYTDDADASYEGISIDITFYNNKSELISFEEIPIVVKIELYGYREIFDSFDHDKMVLVYSGLVEVDHSMRLGEILGKYIRIPFEEIGVDQTEFIIFGTLTVIVQTAQQGEFVDTTDLVSLYLSE